MDQTFKNNFIFFSHSSQFCGFDSEGHEGEKTEKKTAKKQTKKNSFVVENLQKQRVCLGFARMKAQKGKRKEKKKF